MNNTSSTPQSRYCQIGYLVIFLSILLIPNLSYAVTPPTGWSESFTVSGHTLTYSESNGGIYSTNDIEGQYSGLQLVGYGRVSTSSPANATLWYLTGGRGSIIDMQFIEGDPLNGFTDCLSKRFSYYPWGAAATPATTNLIIQNLTFGSIDMSLAGAAVSGRYYPFDYPVRDASCAIISIVPSVGGYSTQMVTEGNITYAIRGGVKTVFSIDTVSDAWFKSYLERNNLLTPTSTTTSTSSKTEDSIAQATSTTKSDIVFLEKKVPYIFTKDLRFRDENNEVNRLQVYLNEKGYFNVPVSGFFGPITKEALKNFQRDNHIYPSVGFFGPVTRNFINSTK